jgi:hypothetical protein
MPKPSPKFPKVSKFHGRHENGARACMAPHCDSAGEFRAPGVRRHGFDGPGDWLWFCLDHIREFNAGYDFFDGMSADEILAAQSPVAGWQTETRAFRPTAGIGDAPRWADFHDPLDAIGARAADIRRRAEGRAKDMAAEAAAQMRYTAKEREALQVMGLTPDGDRTKLRRRYSELVRRYHPDRNGGDRAHEARLQRVVEAYKLLSKAAAYA